MENTLSPRREIAGNTNTSWLKVIALVFMFIDHAGKMCFPAVAEMRLLGRIAFPLYCWCMVVGLCRTRSVPRYLLRIALIGLVSQPLYMVALNHKLTEFNIFLTLFCALCGLWGLKEKRWLSHIWAPVLAMAAAHLLNADYGWRGVLLTFLLYAVRDSRSGIAAVMAAFCLYWGASSGGVNELFGISLTPLMRSKLGSLLSPWIKIQGFALLSLPLMVWQMPGKLRMPRWIGYALYPLHLVLLIALEAAMGCRIRWEHLANVWQDIMNAWQQLAGLL